MFYVLNKHKLIPIDPDRVYAFCPRCGVLHAVDLQAEIADGDFDLLGTLTYCDGCGKDIRAAALAATEREV